eukprot:m.338804 g.338804  ORF g.338804 m.338804 type:complete len:572 (-) comp20567_c0_seq8:94-1809(-)
MCPTTVGIFVLAVVQFTHVVEVSALDNGLRVPPMGWSSWYGFTQNIDEGMIRDMADGMVSSGLHAVGYDAIWIDDGWVLGRDPSTQKPIADPKIFPSGMKNLSAYIHDKGLKFGLYTSKGPKTCLGYQPTQPNRTGSCGYETVDANTYVHDWDVDGVKDDGCGVCLQHDPFVAMRDALNSTGKAVWFAIHGVWRNNTTPGSDFGNVANMWRTGGDLSASSFDMWTNRLDLATTIQQRQMAGPGSFPNPDFLEVGYSPRQAKGNPNVQSALEQRAMFTMWAALPGPLILSADLRPGAACGGIDADALATLTNKEIIAVNQDPLALPMAPVWANADVQVWRKNLSTGAVAVVFFHRNNTLQPSPTPEQKRASVGDIVTMAAVGSAVDMHGTETTPGPIVYRANRSLCVGQIGEAKCANPPTTPQLGLVACDASDVTQQWFAVDNHTGAVRSASAPNHDLNAGPSCDGTHGAMLIYPGTGKEQNEQYKYDTQTGMIASAVNSRRLSVVGAPAPPPPPVPPKSITVTWQQLGWPASTTVVVRDLWNHQSLSPRTTAFTASIAFHEARMYTFTLHQ